MNFSSKLRSYLSLKRESISSLADAIAVNRSYLSHVANGRQKPSSDLVSKIINYFKLGPSEAEELHLLVGNNSPNINLDEAKGVTNKVKSGQLPSGKVPDQTKNIELNFPNNSMVLYSDSALVSSNPFGIVFDFAQTVANTNRQNVVARVGMSVEHARALLDALAKRINETERAKLKDEIKES